MSTPPHTQRVAAMARLPAEPQYWLDNLPPGHGRYNPINLHLLAPRCAWTDLSGTQTDSSDAQTDPSDAQIDGYC